MTTASTTDAARDYLDRVRDLLSDLPEEERGELIQDLAAHLDELESGNIEAQLGSPEAFVAEFRTMAGLDDRQAGRRNGMLDGLAARIESFRNHPTVARSSAHWPAVRPVWVGIRGWLLVAMIAAVYADGVAFRRFPIPEVEHSAFGGLVTVTAATVLSVAAARRARAGRPWRAANVGINLVVAVLLLGSLLNGTLYNARGVYEAEQRTLDYVDRLLPRDIVATTPDGERLDGVLLYDETGRPLDLGELRRSLGLPGPYGEIEGLRPDDGRTLNLYPLAEHPTQGISPSPDDPPDTGEDALRPTTTTIGSPDTGEDAPSPTTTTIGP